MTKKSKPGVSRRSTLALMGAGAVTFATPWVARAQAKTIKVGMPTILSGRVAQLGTSSRNGVTIEVDKINAAGGLAGRQIEMVIRDSKGQPQEAARVARELVNTISISSMPRPRPVRSQSMRSRAISASSVSIPTRKPLRSRPIPSSTFPTRSAQRVRACTIQSSAAVMPRRLPRRRD